MEVILAKTSGFCFGVKRAVDTVYEQTEKSKKIYTYGPIIHNEQVVKDLEEKGVEVIESKEELEALTEGSVVIRSHGVSKDIYDLIEKKGLECMITEGRGQYADPCSMLRACVMLLSHIGLQDRADKLERALDICSFEEKKYVITGRDNGATCSQFGDYVMETLQKL